MKNLSHGSVKQRAKRYKNRAISLLLSVLTVLSVWVALPMASYTEANAAGLGVKAQALVNWYKHNCDTQTTAYRFSGTALCAAMAASGYTVTLDDYLQGNSEYAVKEFAKNTNVKSVKGLAHQNGDVLRFKIKNRNNIDFCGVYIDNNVYYVSGLDGNRIMPVAIGSVYDITYAYRDFTEPPITESFPLLNVGNDFYAEIVNNKPAKSRVYVDTSTDNVEARKSAVTNKDTIIWHFIRQSDGYYVIKSKTDENKVLTCNDLTPYNGSPDIMILNYSPSNDCQKWKITSRKTSKGEYKYSLLPKYHGNNKALSFWNGNEEDKTNAFSGGLDDPETITARFDGKTGQIFNLEIPKPEIKGAVTTSTPTYTGFEVKFDATGNCEAYVWHESLSANEGYHIANITRDNTTGKYSFTFNTSSTGYLAGNYKVMVKANLNGYSVTETITVEVPQDTTLVDLGRRFYAAFQPLGAQGQDSYVTWFAKSAGKDGFDNIFMEKYTSDSSCFLFERQANGRYKISYNGNYLVAETTDGVIKTRNVRAQNDGVTGIREWKIIKVENKGYKLLPANNQNQTLNVDLSQTQGKYPNAFFNISELGADKQNDNNQCFLIDKKPVKGEKVFSDISKFSPVKQAISNGHTFEVFNDAVTYEEAKQICEARNGHLVCITDETKKNAVDSLVKSAITDKIYDKDWKYWIGAEKDDSGNWYWLNNEPVGNGNITPQNGDEYKYAASDMNRQWSTYTEDNNNAPCGFVCEYDYAVHQFDKSPYWVYIKDFGSDNYLQSPTTYEDCKVTEITEEKIQRKQVNYWKLEEQKDGTYTIASSYLENSYLTVVGDTVRVKKPEETEKITDNMCWEVVKEGSMFRLRSKTDRRYLVFGNGTATLVEGIKNGQRLDIIETDLTIKAEATNVKLDLFDYGRQINEDIANQGKDPGDLQLIFSDTEKRGVDGSYYLDNFTNTSSSIEYDNYAKAPKNGAAPTKKYISEKGYPYIYNYEYSSDPAKKSEGDLEYLFDTEQDFVKAKGEHTNDGYNKQWFEDFNIPDFYDPFAGEFIEPVESVSAATFKQGAYYKSKHFQITDSRSLFTIDENGYYSYDSFRNAAYFQKDETENNTGSFKLYDYGLRTSNRKYMHNTFVAQGGCEGRFFPFDLGHVKGTINYSDNYTADDSTKRVDGATGDASREKNPTTSVEYKINDDEYIDRWLGMSMEVDFRISNDYYFNGNEMEYKFLGDDDVWVYIDDVLVIDLSGSHPSLNGSVNFATGEAEWETNFNTKATETKTVYELFVAARDGLVEDLGAEEAKEDERYKRICEAIDNDFDETFTDSNGKKMRLKAGTKHTLKFFLLERAGDVSNCQMKFNLPSAFAYVDKQVTKLDSNFTDTQNFTFKIDVAKENATELSNEELKKLGLTYDKVNLATGARVEENQPINNGEFTLKNGERAELKNLPDGYKYKITEVKDPNYSNSYSTSLSYHNTATDKNTGEYEHLGTKVYDPDVDYATELTTASYSDPYYFTFINERTDTVPLNVHLGVLDVTDKLIKDLGSADYKIKVEYLGDDDKVMGQTELVLLAGDIKDGSMSATIPNLPKGTKYRIVAYKPNDDTRVYLTNYQTSPDGFNQGDRKYTLADDSTNPGGYEGTVGEKGSNVYVTLKLKYLTIEFKYYNRAIVKDGTPADLEETAKSFTTGMPMSELKTIEPNKTEGRNTKLEELIYQKYEDNKIENILDKYECFVSQKSAVAEIKKKPYLKDSGKLTYEECFEDDLDTLDYHFDRYAQPIKGNTEEWVTYYNGEAEVAEEIANETNIDKIVVWLFNNPQKYKVTAHNGNYSETLNAYYNQRLGEKVDYVDSDNNTTNYLSGYGITDDVAGYINKWFNKETIPEENFKYWAADPAGQYPLSTNYHYYYRVVKDMDIYAIYDQSTEKGVRTEPILTDSYTDGANKYKRFNVILHPYGFAHNDQTIRRTAVVYIQDNDGVINNPDKVDKLKEQVLNDILNGTKKQITVDDKNLSCKKVVVEGNDKLTSQNRMQYSLRILNDQLENSFKKFIAVTAVCHGKSATSSSWSISDNLVIYNNGETSDTASKDCFPEANPAAQSYLSLLSSVAGSYERGDADMNKTVDISDATNIQKYLAELTSLNPRQRLLADANGDGRIDIVDVTAIQRRLAGY